VVGQLLFQPRAEIHAGRTFPGKDGFAALQEQCKLVRLMGRLVVLRLGLRPRLHQGAAHFFQSSRRAISTRLPWYGSAIERTAWRIHLPFELNVQRSRVRPIQGRDTMDDDVIRLVRLRIELALDHFGVVRHLLLAILPRDVHSVAETSQAAVFKNGVMRHE
jgi:hypothetical protein